MYSVLGFQSVLAVLSAFGAQAENSFVQVSDQLIIPNSQATVGNYGPVYGVRPCGGPGKLIEWRVEGCNTTDSPCQFPVLRLRRSELEFIPSADIELGLMLVVAVEGEDPKVAYDGPVINGKVMGGNEYTIHATWGARKDLQGKFVTAQYILYRSKEGKAIEVCAEADFEIV